MSNLKSVCLAVLEQLAFNAQKLRELLDLGHTPFRKIFKGHVWTVPGNVPAKFEVCSFEYRYVGSGLDSDHQLHCKIDGPKFADPRLTAVSP